MKKKYRDIKLSKSNIDRLDEINDILSEYQAGGYVLTLRQLYYQLVSRDIIANKQTEYSKLSTLLKEGRMAGVVDWDAIEDRLRVPHLPYWVSGIPGAMNDTINQYRLDRMKGQVNYIEVWVEKDALSGVLKRVTDEYHIRLMVNRGYSSASAMHDSYRRFIRNTVEESRSVKILYLGDFDPSGLDMIRDINDRIVEFKEGDDDGYWAEEMPFEIIPIALTKDQISLYNPPPNPAKVTDPRAGDFIAEYGDTSWEVDALPPNVLHDLLEYNINKLIDYDLYESVLEEEKEDIERLKKFKRANI